MKHFPMSNFKIIVMNKFYTLLLLAFFGVATAQVPNNSFEESIGDGLTLKNWGAFFIQPFAIDVATGNVTSDDIMFENGVGFSMPVGDCVTGNWSMRIGNALNVTQNTVIPGRSSLFNDAESDFHTGWNNGIPLPENANVQFLGFDYMFFPAGDDVAEAKLELFSAEGTSVGKAIITISGFSSNFEYVYVPVNFTSAETPVFMTIDFSMAKEGSVPAFGSSLLVDNVIVNHMALGNNKPNTSAFTVFPTLAENQLNIVKNTSGENRNFTISIVDVSGKTIRQQSMELSDSPSQIDISTLANGVYFLKAISGNTAEVTRFIKK
jgi:hypothetical protein